ncbi:hypothetical protein WN943_028609 [Citrus x changshan-huyou]
MASVTGTSACMTSLSCSFKQTQVVFLSLYDLISRFLYLIHCIISWVCFYSFVD